MKHIIIAAVSLVLFGCGAHNQSQQSSTTNSNAEHNNALLTTHAKLVDAQAKATLVLAAYSWNEISFIRAHPQIQATFSPTDITRFSERLDKGALEDVVVIVP